MPRPPFAKETREIEQHLLALTEGGRLAWAADDAGRHRVVLGDGTSVVIEERGEQFSVVLSKGQDRQEFTGTLRSLLHVVRAETAAPQLFERVLDHLRAEASASDVAVSSEGTRE